MVASTLLFIYGNRLTTVYQEYSYIWGLCAESSVVVVVETSSGTSRSDELFVLYLSVT